jgi:hypothetical protein
MHAHEAMPIKCMPTRRIPKVIAEEPEMKSVIKDELLKELEDFIKEVDSGGEVDPRAYPG